MFMFKSKLETIGHFLGPSPPKQRSDCTCGVSLAVISALSYFGGYRGPMNAPPKKESQSHEAQLGRMRKPETPPVDRQQRNRANEK